MPLLLWKELLVGLVKPNLIGSRDVFCQDDPYRSVELDSLLYVDRVDFSMCALR